MQPYPRALDLFSPGQLHGTGCLSARAMDAGFATVVWRVCLGPVCGWVWVSVTLPALAGVLGGCVWVQFAVSSLFCWMGRVMFVVGPGFQPAPHLSWLGLWDVRGCVRAPPAPRRSGFRCAVWACVLGSGFQLRPDTPWRDVGVCICYRAPPRGLLHPLVGGAVRGCVVGAAPRHPWLGRPGVCVFVRAPRFLPTFPGWGVLCGHACWARGPSALRPSWLGCWGVFCFPEGGGRVVIWLFGVGRWLSRSRVLRSLSPHPPSFGLRCWLLFFFLLSAWHVSARFGCPFSWLAVAPGLVLPVLPGWSPCAPSGVLSSVPFGWRGFGPPFFRHPQPVGSGPRPHARTDEKSGVGERPTPDAAHPGKRCPPRAPSCRSHSAQGQLARAPAVEWVTGPHAHTPAPTARGWRTTTARPVGGQSGEGGRLTSDAPHNGRKAPPPRTPFHHPHSEQRRPARAHAVGLVLGPHACTDRTRDTRVAEPWLPAPEDWRPGEGQRPTPDASHNGGRPPPPRTAPLHPHGTQPPQGMQAKGTVLGPHTHTPAPTARGWRTPTARPVGGQSGEGERLNSDTHHNGGRHPPRGCPSATPTASNASPQGRTLWGWCWVTPAPTAPGTHGSRNPGCPLQRTGGRGRDSA